MVLRQRAEDSLWDWFSHSTLWVLRIKLRSLAFTASNLIHWGILVMHVWKNFIQSFTPIQYLQTVSYVQARNQPKMLGIASWHQRPRICPAWILLAQLMLIMAVLSNRTAKWDLGTLVSQCLRCMWDSHLTRGKQISPHNDKTHAALIAPSYPQS